MRTLDVLRNLGDDEYVTRPEQECLGRQGRGEGVLAVFGHSFRHAYYDCYPEAVDHPAILALTHNRRGKVLTRREPRHTARGLRYTVLLARVGDLRAILKWMKEWKPPQGMVSLAQAQEKTGLGERILKKLVAAEEGKRQRIRAPSADGTLYWLEVIRLQLALDAAKKQGTKADLGRRIVWVREPGGKVRDYYLFYEAIRLAGVNPERPAIFYNWVPKTHNGKAVPSSDLGGRVLTCLFSPEQQTFGRAKGCRPLLFLGDDLRTIRLKRTGEKLEAPRASQGQAARALVSDRKEAKPASAPPGVERWDGPGRASWKSKATRISQRTTPKEQTRRP